MTGFPVPSSRTHRDFNHPARGRLAPGVGVGAVRTPGWRSTPATLPRMIIDWGTVRDNGGGGGRGSADTAATGPDAGSAREGSTILVQNIIRGRAAPRAGVGVGAVQGPQGRSTPST
jgi:hypothetical protein